MLQGIHGNENHRGSASAIGRTETGAALRAVAGSVAARLPHLPLAASRLLSLDAPERFTDLIQHRKLFDHDPRFPTLIDKLGAKRFVEDRLGKPWVTPTLWTGTTLPETPSWPRPFVVKSRYGCNQRRFVRIETDDWQAIRRASARWMQAGYGRWLDE